MQCLACTKKLADGQLIARITHWSNEESLEQTMPMGQLGGPAIVRKEAHLSLSSLL